MKTIRKLLEGVDVIKTAGNLDAGISGIEYDSRKIKKGCVFAAIQGFDQDGMKYVDDAVSRGAVAVVSDRKETQVKDGTVVITVNNIRKALACLSANYYGHPSKDLKVIGITGTNGKTTTSFVIDSILRSAGKKNGIIGTINYRFGKEVIEATQTTPESSDLQRMFRIMADNNTDYCVVEVSSHSLILDRVYQTSFAVGIYTNLTQDHLDFHHNEEEYFQAKLKLFTDYDLKKAVVNIDDKYGRTICKRSSAKIMTVGIKERADIFAENIMISIGGIDFTIKAPGVDMRIHSDLIGLHNVYNVLCAVGAALSLGVSPENIKKGVNDLHGVPGRFEKIDEGQNFTVVVDYAHTDDALKNVITAAKELTDNRIIVVFGCGGNRDAGKRPKMGEVAGKYADYSIITSDNPRKEKPMSIINDVERGIGKIVGRDKYCSIQDREQAIEYAIKMAKAGDIVIIAGKGHEKYQILGDKRIYFNDCDAVRQTIKKRMECELLR